MRRKNPFPGVTRSVDRHGKVRFRFRSKGVDTYLPSAYASAEFRAAYEAALAGAKGKTNKSRAERGTIKWLAEQYMRSPRYQNRAEGSRRVLRRELDWLCSVAGDLPFARMKTHHVEALMAKKTGPAAANKVKKNLSILFNYAIKKGFGITFNPARYADKWTENPDGFHTWTEQEISEFKERHPTGTKARLALALFLCTGASRQDAARMGWQNISDGRIVYRRGKTGIEANLPILPELYEELQNVPRDQLLFLTHGAGRPYKPETLGNWFKDRCTEAKVPGTAHGLRKAGATRLANFGATPDEIRAFMAHKTNKEGATYTKKADRARLADSGLARWEQNEHENVSNLSAKLDKKADK